MPPNNIECCGTCVYFVDKACHRHAPQQVFGSGTGFATWEWMKPPKGEDDWCGDHHVYYAETGNE